MLARLQRVQLNDSVGSYEVALAVCELLEFLYMPLVVSALSGSVTAVG